MVGPDPIVRCAAARAGVGVALWVILAGCYESHGWGRVTGDGVDAPELRAEDGAQDPGMDQPLRDAEDDVTAESGLDGPPDGAVLDAVDPLALPEDCVPVFPAGSQLCRDGVYCPEDWSLCCVTNLCGPPGRSVRGCCNDTSCGHATLPFGLFGCIGAAHEDFLPVADCGECPAEFGLCCNHSRTPLFCTHERPYAWSCRELGE